MASIQKGLTKFMTGNRVLHEDHQGKMIEASMIKAELFKIKIIATVKILFL